MRKKKPRLARALKVSPQDMMSQDLVPTQELWRFGRDWVWYGLDIPPQALQRTADDLGPRRFWDGRWTAA